MARRSIHFVSNAPTNILNDIERDGVDHHWQHFASGKMCWTVQTYFILKSFGHPVTLSNRCRRNAINVGHFDDLHLMAPRWGSLTVIIRADRRSKCVWADYEIVQNKSKVTPNADYIPHWPQPGLKKRDANRQSIKNVAFFGLINHNVLTQYHIEKDLALRGCVFIEKGASLWNDYSDVDIAVAIRNFGHEPYDHKPPSKLINAWYAGVAFISGNDSAYRQVGAPGKNYLIANNYNELLKNIDWLKSNTEIYNSLIKNGEMHARDYSRLAVADQWIKILSKMHDIRMEAPIKHLAINKQLYYRYLLTKVRNAVGRIVLQRWKMAKIRLF